MFLQANYEDLAGQIVNEGEYEVVIKTANENATKGGTEFIDIQMQIRKDIMQPHAGQFIFYKIWKKKQPTEADPGGYVGHNIQQVSKAVLIPNGAQIKTIDEWLKLITGRPVRVKVKHEMYNDNKQVVIAWVNESKQPNVSDVAVNLAPEYTQTDSADSPF